MITFKRIMCPVDFSEPSLKALGLAYELAVKFDAELEIVHVVADMPIMTMGEPSLGGSSASVFNVAEYQKEMGENAEKRMREIVDGLNTKKIGMQITLKYGYPSEVIIDTVKANKTDLLVMSTHGCSGFKCFLFGSVAEKVIKAIPCPVLIVGSAESGKQAP